MFGDDVRDEITSNILGSSGYPRALTFLMCLFIGIIPLTKIPLNARPIISTVEVLCGSNQTTVSGNESFRALMRVVVCIGTILFLTFIAIVFPAFDSIMAFMGSGLCFTICVT
jgi:solute carrier family 32 (vesicular inhibitory amino acid transporter)